MKALIKKEKLLKETIKYSYFAKGSIGTVCANCNRANCICKTKTNRKAYKLTYKDQNQKTKSVYIPKEKLKEMKMMIANYKKHKQILDNILALNIEIFKNSG